MGRNPIKENQNPYFRARKQAAEWDARLESRERASELIGIAAYTLADYELGNVKRVPADKVLIMADLYNAPWLLSNYCKNECPICGFLPLASYVDSYFEGTLDKFKAENPDLFKRDGTLKAEFVKADEIIQRIERDDYFMKFMSGKKQVIMTGELFGTKWKIKMDSYIQDIAIVDLKVMASITKLEWVRDIGYLDFVRYWGYDIQGAIYQEIVRQNTGKKLPFYIAGATKESEPDIRIIHITDNYLAEALNLVEMNMARVLAVKTGNAEPDRCELCDCCRKTRVLKAPISITDLTAGI